MITPARSERRRSSSEAEIWKVLGFLVLLAVALYVAIYHRPARLPVSRVVTSPDVTEVGKNLSSPGYFAEFKMEREKLYQKQISMIQEMLARSDLEPGVKQSYHAKYLALVDSMGKELDIEGILKTKGWDALAFVTSDSCTVAVWAGNLSSDEVVVIADVVQRITGLGLDKIAVVAARDE
ncbi:MAG TPA: SpoIIIAH-like family protein [Firmicutes bacterium]|nr:SpoIIIAH-like family protein [Candidatus Fermentithermobacillaceae bacterium]